jgi:4-amino-4-deoxy-L-arabinose transferase-like glycosyltransferase
MKTLIFWLFFSVTSSPVLFGLAVVLIIGCILSTRKADKVHKAAWRSLVILPIIIGLLTVSAWKIHRFNSHVVDPKSYEAIEKGMAKEQVSVLLGQPTDRNLAVWTYRKPGIFEFAEIYFDKDGKVKQKLLDR